MAAPDKPEIATDFEDVKPQVATDFDEPKLLENRGDNWDYARNVGTAAGKILTMPAGILGDTRDLFDLGTSGIESLARHVIPGVENKSAAQIRADHAAREKRAQELGLKPGVMASLPTSHELYERHVKPLVGEYKPTTLAGELGQAGVQAAVPLPGGKEKVGERLIELAPGVWRFVKDVVRKAAPTARKSGVQATGGVTGQIASDLSGGDPYWALAGSIAGPTAAETTIAGARHLVPPQTKEGQARAAAHQYGEDITRAATPDEKAAVAATGRTPVQAALAQAQAARDNLPTWLGGKEKQGAQPTVAELSQSRGLALGERAATASDPEGAGALISARQDARARAQKEAAQSTVDPEAHGLELRDRLAKEAAELEDRVNQALPATGDLEATGSGTRAPLAEGKKQAEDARTQLYDNVEKTFGDQWLHIPALKGTSKQLMESVEGYETAKKSNESIDLALNMPEQVQFSKLRVYLKDLNNKIASARNNPAMTEEVGRLKALRSAVWNDLHGAVKNRLETEFGPEGTRGPNAEAAMQQALAHEVAQWQAGVTPPTGPKVPLGVAGVAALKEANEAQQRLGTTFREGVVGDLLKQDRFGQAWNVKDAHVPKKAFPGGDDGYSVTKSVLEAGGPDVLPSIKEAAIMSLREVMNKNHLDPTALEKWQKKYGSSLKAIDEVEPGFSKRFENLANTHSELAASFLGADPQTAANIMGKLLADKTGGPPKLKKLLAEAGNDPAVIEGLKKLALDHMFGAAEKSGMPREFGGKLAGQINAYRPALTQLFGPDHMQLLESLIADANSQRGHGQRMASSVGNSATQHYQELADRLRNEPQSTWREHIGLGTGLTSLSGLAGYGGALWQGMDHPAAMLTGAATGVTLGSLGWLNSKLKSRGINGIKDAYRAGMADPQLGMRMLQFAAESPGSAGWWQRVGPLLLASPYLARPGLDSGEDKKRKGKASGGAVKAKCDHAACAARLVQQADKIRRGHARHTKVLLNAPDDAVAKALAIAGRGL